MRSKVLSSENALTETHTDLFLTIQNDNDTQLSFVSNSLKKVEENNNLSNKDHLFNLVLQLQNDIKNLKISLTKQNTTRRTTTPYTMKGNHKRFITNKFCWTHEACAHISDKYKPQVQVTKQILYFKINKEVVALIIAFL